MENTLENNRIFDAKGLVSDEPSREGRLKYWTNELCAKRPQTFDFAITVGFAYSVTPQRLTHVAGRRWNPPLRQLAVPKDSASCSLVRHGFSWISHQI